MNNIVIDISSTNGHDIMTRQCLRGGYRQQPNTPHTAVGSQVFFICTSLFFVFIAQFFYFIFTHIVVLRSIIWKRLREPNSTACLPYAPSYMVSFYHDVLYWESIRIDQKFEKKTLAKKHSWVAALRLYYFSKVSAIRPVNSAWASSACKKTGTTFWMYCLSVPDMAGSVVGILGYLIWLQCYVNAVSIKDSSLLLYAVA